MVVGGEENHKKQKPTMPKSLSQDMYVQQQQRKEDARTKTQSLKVCKGKWQRVDGIEGEGKVREEGRGRRGKEMRMFPFTSWKT